MSVSSFIMKSPVFIYWGFVLLVLIHFLIIDSVSSLTFVFVFNGCIIINGCIDVFMAQYVSNQSYIACFAVEGSTIGTSKLMWRNFLVGNGDFRVFLDQVFYSVYADSFPLKERNIAFSCPSRTWIPLRSSSR